MRRKRPWFLLAPVLALLCCGSLPSVAQEVTLSLDRFHELWKKAHPPEPDPAQPTGSLALESAELAVVVEGELARLTTTLLVSLTGELPQVLALPELGPILEVTSDAKTPANLEVEATRLEGKSVLRLRGAGRFHIRLLSALPAFTQAAAVALERRLELELPRAASVTGSLAVGSEVRQVTASGGGLLEAEEPGRYRFVGEPGAKLVLGLSGAPRVAPKRPGGEPLIFEVDSASALAASRARLRLSAWIAVAVVSGELERLEVPVPAGFEVLSVTGPELLGWELVQGRLEITLREPTRAGASFEAQLAADPTLDLEAPLLVPAGARQVRSVVKVALRSSDGLLESVERRGAEPLAASDLARFGPGFATAPGEPLRVEPGASPPRWRVTWAESGEVLSAQIDRLVVEAVVGESGMARMRLWAEIRNGEPSLVLRPPPGARLVKALRGGVELTLGERGGAWVVPMVVQAAPQVVYLEALVPVEFPRGAGRLTLPLPGLSVPSSRVEVRLLAPPGFSYRLAEGSKAGVVEPPPGGTMVFVAVPGPAGFLAPPLGFSTLEASWSAWSAEPPPVQIDVSPVEKGSSREKRSR